jgi:hypothetical protein
VRRRLRAARCRGYRRAGDAGAGRRRRPALSPGLTPGEPGVRPQRRGRPAGPARRQPGPRSQGSPARLRPGRTGSGGRRAGSPRGGIGPVSRFRRVLMSRSMPRRRATCLSRHRRDSARSRTMAT